ncbi:MAG TPA: ATP-binding protein [Polyangia bacterium]|jgi:signal transduction histidine kinase
MSVRIKLAVVLCGILTGAIAITGYLLLREVRRHSATQITAQQQIYLEGRALTFGDNVRVLAEELRRLSRRAEVDLADNDVRPEAQLLSAAHQNSVLYNMGILIIAADGRLLHAEPARPDLVGKDAGLEGGIERVRSARGTVMQVLERRGQGAVLAISVPVRARGTFSGAIVGEVALGRASLFSHVLEPGPGEPRAEIMLVDAQRKVLYGSANAGTDPAWRAVLPHAAGARRAGVIRSGGPGPKDSLFAYAPTGVGQLTLAYRWAWDDLDVEADHLFTLLWRILAGGLALALVLAVVFSGYLTRPLKTLGEVARRIAEGQFPELRQTHRRDEIGALSRAFEHMGESLRTRDQRIRDDIDERERLNHELEALAESLERRVRERTAELQATQQQLVETERFAAMGKAAAAMAHELKNSLGGISMSVDLILQQSPGGSLRIRHQLQDEIVRLRDVTNSLLDFAREPRLDVASRDVHRIIRRAAEMLSEVLAEQGASLVLDLADAGAPLAVPCDAAKLEGVLINLIKNAAEAVGRTGRPGEVRVRTRAADGATVLEVEDDGPGVDGDAAGHLFEPFFSTKPSGTGLGLATAHRIIAAHGGHIEHVAPAAGRGACFRITLTAARVRPALEATP